MIKQRNEDRDMEPALYGNGYETPMEKLIQNNTERSNQKQMDAPEMKDWTEQILDCSQNLENKSPNDLKQDFMNLLHTIFEKGKEMTKGIGKGVMNLGHAAGNVLSYSNDQLTNYNDAQWEKRQQRRVERQEQKLTDLDDKYKKDLEALNKKYERDKLAQTKKIEKTKYNLNIGRAERQEKRTERSYEKALGIPERLREKGKQSELQQIQMGLQMFQMMENSGIHHPAMDTPMYKHAKEVIGQNMEMTNKLLQYGQNQMNHSSPAFGDYTVPKYVQPHHLSRAQEPSSAKPNKSTEIIDRDPDQILENALKQFHPESSAPAHTKNALEF